MKTSTVLRSLVTAAPYLHTHQLFKRDEITCGDLMSAYSNVQAPICSGATSICTFDGSLQGCCDDQNQCQFYTTCVGPYAPETCIGSFCLACSGEAPYCIKYNFWNAESQRAYDGYSCAKFQATQTIFGIATSILGATTAPSSSAAAVSSTTESSSSSEVPVLTRFNTTRSAFSSSSLSSNSSSSITTTSVTSSASSNPTTTASPVHESRSVSHTGAIAGGVVGGLLAVALVALAVFCVRRRHGKRKGQQRPYIGSRVAEIQRYD